MASRKKRQSPEPTRYDDPLLIDQLPEGKPGYTPNAPLVVTGLSEEEDAQRYLALRFNDALRFCRNCETFNDRDKLPLQANMWCFYCGDTLSPVGATPRKRKFDVR